MFRKNNLNEPPRAKVAEVFYEPPRFSPRFVLCFNLFLILLAAIVIGLIAAHYIVFGSVAGKWVYDYKEAPGARAILFFALLAPAMVAATRLGSMFVERQKIIVLLLLLGCGIGYQEVIRTLQPLTLAYIIHDDNINSFLKPATTYTASYYLKHYYEVTPKLARHAQSNMPGKVLVFYGLKFFTRKLQVMGHIIIALSSVGALLAFGIARRLFHNTQIALYSMMLYFLIPAKLYFLPLLNVLTLPEIMFPLWLLVCHLDNPRRWLPLPLGVGVGLFIVFMMEPLAFFSGIFFAAAMAGSALRKRLTLVAAAWIILGTIAGFLASYALFYHFTNFDPIRCFRGLMTEAFTYHQKSERPYGLWLVHNFKQFSIDVGVTQTILYLFMAGWVLRLLVFRPKQGELPVKKSEFMSQSGPLLLLAFTIGTVLLDLAGVDRGESPRIWMFFTPFIQIIAAWGCVSRFNKYTFDIMTAATVLQATLTLSMVSFLGWK